MTDASTEAETETSVFLGDQGAEDPVPVSASTNFSG